MPIIGKKKAWDHILSLEDNAANTTVVNKTIKKQ